ncbi:hypothetical protein PS6_005633 [Mucor atramentarius]
MILGKSTTKTFVKIATDEAQTSAPTKRFSIKTVIISTLALFTLVYMTASIGCSISRFNSTHNPICKRVAQLPSPYTLYSSVMDRQFLDNGKERSRAWLDQKMNNYYETAEPYISKLQQGYRWSETTSVKSAFKQTGRFAKSLAYTEENQLRPVRYINQLQGIYLKPVWDYIKNSIHDHLVRLRYQMDDYIESGSHKSTHMNGAGEENVNSGIVEDKLKRTAKRILDYIDQINEASVSTGMKQDEARIKAQEIIKSITDATTTNNAAHKNMVDINKDSSDVDRIAFEIQEIMEVAALEKIQLDEQLDLIQAKVSSFAMTENDEDTDERDVQHLTIVALKSEIDNLRAIAENNVRERARTSLKVVESINKNASIKNRMKEDVQSAQRAALKDLRQIYVKLYQTNKLIDKLTSY